ncbi:MAG: dihydrodipicolinate synthase family protein [Acidobacteriaceae bacterium]|nr:dihydrodipicolinate synthase family protein [Acidobacteriaceae bacterium]
MSFSGVFPIAITPFHPDGSIDMPSQRRLIRYLIDAGAHGLGLFGNASEGYALSSAERAALLREIVDEVGGRVPLIVSTGHTGTDVAVELSKTAQDSGADALMVLPPYFLRPDADGIFRYYESISQAVSIPIMVQDAPLMTQVNIGGALLARMGRELENVRYVKVEAPPTSLKISEVMQLSNGGPVLFGGLNGNFLIEEIGRGARGTMPGSDMIPEFVRIWNHCEAQRLDQAWAEFTRILPLIRFELQPGLGVSAMKQNLVAAGVIASARVRHPTREVDAQGIEELKVLRRRLE